ncbi:exosortase/archaeosortase family protein [Klenkia sp. LSe6-5]|uniref:Exosortase/archaeosortase family protein n=1 Tax=Klenkia sesuvii TaxID=3103137 RepID=A0ABU8DR79_9ACTN
MTAAAITPLPRPTPRATRRRLGTVAAEIGVAVGICLVGYYYAADWFRTQEAALAVRVLRWLGFDDVSAVIPQSILIYRGPDDVLQGIVTTSCSSILTVVGLTALTAVVLRSRGLHAVGGLLVALVAVVAANCVRLVLSTLAGYAWGGPAMTLFHDWVGTIWALASTLAGFLLMVCLTLPAAERAEQDVAGRHTARRPDAWARPGLGYRVAEVEQRAAERRRHRFSPTAFFYRRVLPRRVAARLAARREAGRIDYRIGHLTSAQRVATVQRLAGEGLGVHTASLLAVATYDTDIDVLDALADAVAARQWEPVVSHRVASLRLWARGWLLARRQFSAGNSSTTLIEAPRPAPPAPGRLPGRGDRATPRSFARAVPSVPAVPTRADLVRPHRQDPR